MDQEKLHQHIFKTYTHLRIGMALTALAFPLILLLGGLAIGVEHQGSMSAYYHTPMRNAFVGILFMIGPFLFLYKGFSWQENSALNFAGLLAVGIAVFPMDKTAAMMKLAPYDTYANGTVHGICAIVFFISISYVCIFRASDTLALIGDSSRRKRYKMTYRILGILMVLFPLLAAGMTNYLQDMFNPDTSITIFIVELAGVWVFGFYWIVKSLEIRETHADKDALSHSS
jgi:hypothetical protein